MAAFPSRSRRARTWSETYKRQGQRWGLLPSLAAHLALSEVGRHDHEGARIVDCGCGYGRDLFLFRSVVRHASIVGVDSSDTAIRMAHALVPSCTLIGDDALAAFDSKHRYDLVFCNYFLHLLSDGEALRWLRSVNSSLDSAGTLIVSLVSKNDVHFRRGKKIGPDAYEVRAGLPWRFHSLQTARDLFTSAGFKVETIFEFEELEMLQGNPDRVSGIYIRALVA